VRLFTTLVRFDAVYYSHFKCNLRRLVDYPNLWRYTRRIYALPGVKATTDFRQIKEHYYRSMKHLNPGQIVPKGPLLDFSLP
jgi:putative glutathione S-transferase